MAGIRMPMTKSPSKRGPDTNKDVQLVMALVLPIVAFFVLIIIVMTTMCKLAISTRGNRPARSNTCQANGPSHVRRLPGFVELQTLPRQSRKGALASHPPELDSW
ncbi:hypothetical protein PENNAL_c0085G03222 [Penicillium nalgiovense]|uniref:Uncharacterized protein n=1 Tax=Penicillium nalgiovense TaxID=60175 RepID=A0A1V6XFP0_PENNA|nr:hypothetical protein PENNAL_c0085G03222 [Penicillium nalgiovense]